MSAYAWLAADFNGCASAPSFAGLPLATAERREEAALRAARKSVPPRPCSQACIVDRHDGEGVEDAVNVFADSEQDARNIVAVKTMPIIVNERIISPA